MKFKTLFLAVLLCGVCCFGVSAAPAEVAAAPAAEVAAAPAAAPAAEKAAPAAKKSQSNWKSMLMPIAIVVIMILLFSRANKKQQRQRQEMMDKVVKGAKVMLSSGIFGKVVEVREKEFLVEIAENVRILVLKEAVANVIDEEKKEESK